MTGETRRSRIAFVLPSLKCGGSERVLLSLLARLDPGQYERTLLIFENLGPFADLVPADVTVHVIGRRRLRKAFPGMLRTLRRLRPEIIFSTLGYLNLAVLAMRPFLPGRPLVVIREPNTPSRSLPHLANSTLLRLGYHLLYRYADIVICQSNLISVEFIEDFGISPDRIVHLANPVDVNAIRKAAHAPERCGGPGPRFVAAGQLTHQKGFDRLLDLMAETSPACHLTIFGEGSELKALAERGRQLGISGRVQLAGYSSCPWPSFSGADAFLLPSRWEGMPNVALEALACGTPVIGTPESGGLSEVAAIAPHGAVTIVPMGPEFLRAMREVKPRSELSLRPSLLPVHFEANVVSAMFADLLAA